MPVSPHSPWVSMHTTPTSPIVRAAAHASQMPGNRALGTLTEANASRGDRDNKNLILAYAVSLGVLGLAVGLHIKGLPKPGFLNNKTLPDKKAPSGIRALASKSGLLEYLLGCGGGSVLGYFVHQTGEKARVKGYNKRFKELKGQAVDLQSENADLKKAQSGDIQAQIKLGRIGVVDSLLDWVTQEQTIDSSTLIDKLTGLRNGG